MFIYSQTFLRIIKLAIILGMDVHSSSPLPSYWVDQNTWDQCSQVTRIAQYSLMVCNPQRCPSFISSVGSWCLCAWTFLKKVIRMTWRTTAAARRNIQARWISAPTVKVEIDRSQMRELYLKHNEVIARQEEVWFGFFRKVFQHNLGSASGFEIWAKCTFCILLHPFASCLRCKYVRPFSFLSWIHNLSSNGNAARIFWNPYFLDPVPSKSLIFVHWNGNLPTLWMCIAFSAVSTWVWMARTTTPSRGETTLPTSRRDIWSKKTKVFCSIDILGYTLYSGMKSEMWRYVKICREWNAEKLRFSSKWILNWEVMLHRRCRKDQQIKSPELRQWSMAQPIGSWELRKVILKLTSMVKKYGY